MKLAERTELIEERINVLMEALRKDYETTHNRMFGSFDPNEYDYECVRGVKYYKINQLTSIGNGQYGRSVHAFVSRQTGAVYKPASWKAPAKHARYNLLDDVSYQDCLRRANWAGVYLYMR